MHKTENSLHSSYTWFPVSAASFPHPHQSSAVLRDPAGYSRPPELVRSLLNFRRCHCIIFIHE